jgi:hypothetical protein
MSEKEMADINTWFETTRQFLPHGAQLDVDRTMAGYHRNPEKYTVFYTWADRQGYMRVTKPVIDAAVRNKRLEDLGI